jgi:flagellar biosynthesis chaperone FliJ
MAASQSLRRLHDIREAEERQRRTLMESSVRELRRLETALKNTFKLATQARALVASSVRTGELLDRIAAVEEMAAAERLAKTLPARIAAAERQVASVREEFFAKRIERRQVETLLDAENAQEAIETNRKSQMALDDWHSSERTRKNRKARLDPHRI